MQVKQYLRDGKIHRGLEVTRIELEELEKKYDFISVAKADRPAIVEVLSGDVVGVIMGDIQNINESQWDGVEDIVNNPDCWLVSNRAMKPYKSLDGKFNICEAKQLMKLGYKIKHNRWINSFLIYVPGSTFKVNRPPLLGAFEEGTEVKYGEHIDLVQINPVTYEIEVKVYSFSSSDVFEEEWEIYKEKGEVK